ncbi:hypothetical protein DN745_08360 [Bradymonas sediminis]|uniref:Uncharacterized protein n=1 Tax=Bradymonas sediminis TaxID=1548548 RepID=A0A2Z4FK45_9DELT|nr:hypothetical protein DN745_08360 [Bradymonas sediminis]
MTDLIFQLVRYYSAVRINIQKKSPKKVAAITATRDAVQHAILRYLMWSNAHHIYSFNDYVSPMQFERFILTREAAA